MKKQKKQKKNKKNKNISLNHIKPNQTKKKK